MASGTRIEVSGNRKLTFNNSHVQSCDGINMWKGISIIGSSNFTVNPISIEITNGSILEDAEELIHDPLKCGIKIYDSHLNRNNTAIWFDGLGSYESILDMSNSQITCYQNALLPATASPCLLAPYNSPTANASTNGIWCDYAGVKRIGLSGNLINTFDNLANAIVSLDSRPVIRNNEFNRCGFQNSFGGFGGMIYVENIDTIRDLIVGGNSSEGNIFTNGTLKGILIKNKTNTTITYNDFTDVYELIRLSNQNPYSISFDISHNFGLHFGFGIKLADCYKVLHGLISYNKLNYYDNLTYNSGIGIDVYNPSNAVENISITQNEIRNCQSAIRGVHLYSNCSIDNNTIYVHNQAPVTQYRGIQVMSSRMLKVESNNINFQHSGNVAGMTGIEGSFLNQCLIDYNILNNNGINYRGIYLTAINNGTQLTCNQAASYPQAVFLGSSISSPTYIVDQGLNGTTNDNQFYPLSNCNYRFQGWISSNSNVNFSGISNSQNITYPYTNVFGLTANSVLPDNMDCSVSLYTDLDRDVLPIIRSQVQFNVNENAFRYNLKSEVYKTITYNPELLSNQEVLNWYNSMKNENLGKIENIIQSVFTLPVSDDTGLTALLNTANQELNSINPDNAIEENKIIYLNLLINKIIIGINLNYNDSIHLFNIACQNSILGGEAVIWSRLFLDLKIDDENGCQSKLNIAGNYHQYYENEIIPNPNDGNFRLSGSDNISRMEVFDIFGKLIESIQVTGAKTISLKLENGCYICYFYLNNEAIPCINKIIISK